MRTVYLINLSFGLAGIERRFANLWRVLHKRGHVNPVLVIPSSLAKLLGSAGLLPSDRRGLIVVREPAISEWLGRTRLPSFLDIPVAIVRSRLAAFGFRAVWRRIANEPDAILHVGLNVSSLRPPDIPAVYECVDATLEQLGGRHYRRAARRRCIVHCQTDRIRTELDREFASRSARWRTVTNPTYFAQYAAAMPDKPRDPTLIAFVGRLSPEKNPLLFIEAVAMARARGVDCRAVILGEGPLRADCEALLKRLGVDGVVSIDFVPNPIEVLHRAAAAVTLQTGDNFGSQSMLEAMGAGCAIIASDVGETRRIVTDEIGIRVPLSASAVSDAIRQLLKNPDHCAGIGRRAAEIARTTYSADTYAAFVESLYEAAAEYHRTLTSAGERSLAALASKS